ncbi:hypothetical protein OG871_40355 (plasmid) [Kitasatospora sp. NBC_00374]|uniref:hypothetical protein n=1 Tax=Kitasatospora sp. NBC_00374 TaxID=2975964 RepID=UPI002F90E12A
MSHPLTPRQVTSLHTGAYLLPSDPDCPESIPVLAAAGLRVGVQIQEDGTVYIGINAEEADPSLRSTDGRLRGIEVDVPGEAQVRRQRAARPWSGIWKRLLRHSGTRPGTSSLHQMTDIALELVIEDAHSELHRRAVLAIAHELTMVCAERGWPAPVELRTASSYDDYDSTTAWSPNGVEITFADQSRRVADFGRRELGESLATEMVRAYLAEASEHQDPPQDAELVVTLRPSPGFHINRF